MNMDPTRRFPASVAAYVALAFFVLTLFCCNPLSASAGTLPADNRVSVAGFALEGLPSEIAVPPGSEVEIYFLLRLKAPEIPVVKERPTLNVALVIDRSGSMSDAKKLDYAVRAGKEVVRLLTPADNLAVVDYDDKVRVLSTLAPVKDKQALNRLLDALEPGGYTNLSGGLEAGIKQLQRKRIEGVNRVILLSDGLANRGVTDAKGVARIGASAADKGITISTMGLGLDYDETMMQTLAQRGGGQYSYIRDSEDLPGFFRQELALAAQSVTKGLSLRFTPDPRLINIKIYGYTTAQEGKDTIIEMGDMYSGEERQVLIRANMKTADAEGVNSPGTATLIFTPAVGDKAGAQTLKLPLSASIVADAKAREAKNAEAKALTEPVKEEAALLVAEEAHVQAVAQMQGGDVAGARATMNRAKEALKPMAAAAPVLANKVAALEEDERRLEAAASNLDLQKDMAKRSKNSLYQSSMGKSQALLLQLGDKGAMVEKLQRALQDKKFYSGPIDGVYSEAVKEAVSAFQKADKLNVDGIAGQSTMRALGM